MFTLYWRRRALRDEGGNPLRALPSRTFYKSAMMVRSADWGSDTSYLTSTWWSFLNMSLILGGNSIILKYRNMSRELLWHHRECLVLKMTSYSFYIITQRHSTPVRLLVIEGIISLYLKCLTIMTYLFLLPIEHGQDCLEWKICCKYPL